jgi:site-specific DNA-methyltransferase (adenine-specific)
MKPYYEQDGITIYHGDCREVLPTILADAGCFVTDPPYGIDGGRGGQARLRNKVYRADWDDTEEYVRAVCIPVIESLLSADLRGAITPGLRCMWHYPKPVSVGCFWQPAAVAYEPWGLCVSQPILYYGRDPMAGLGQKPTGKQVTEAPPKLDHPCPKPVRAWTWLVDKIAGHSTTTVVDPFLGAGTTLLAAKQLGHKAIGIECEERYCEIAAKRLAQGVLFGANT